MRRRRKKAVNIAAKTTSPDATPIPALAPELNRELLPLSVFAFPVPPGEEVPLLVKLVLLLTEIVSSFDEVLDPVSVADVLPLLVVKVVEGIPLLDETVLSCKEDDSA